MSGGTRCRGEGWQNWRWNWAIAALLFVGCSLTTIVAQREQGIVRDEVVYMDFGSRYAEWWILLVTGQQGVTSRETITTHFGGERATDGNREHPPLMKTLFGLSKLLLHDQLGWTSETTGYRVPTALMNALLVVLVFFFGARLRVSKPRGRLVGIVSALLVFFLPRSFFHAGLATFDAPMVTFWFASLVAYYRSLTSRWGFLLFGLCIGLALATKHNAIMLPAVFLTHYVYILWRARGRGERGLIRPQMLLGLFVVGPLVLILLWPWLWFDTGQHLREWIGFHLQHVHYNFEYLGRNWNAPPFPWHVAIVTTLFTVPLATLVAATCGVGTAIFSWRCTESNDDDFFPALLLILAAGVAVGPFLLRTTPIFGAEKHWAPAMPSLCLFAGLGVVVTADKLSMAIASFRPGWHRSMIYCGTFTCMVGAVVGAASVETVHSHPYSLSHYNALAGGAAGGANHGMNRQFWGYAVRGVFPFLERFTALNKPISVYSHDASPAWHRYQKEEVLAPRFPDAGREQSGIHKSKIAIVIHERHFNRHDYLIWTEYRKVQPSFVLEHDGVPLVSVYVRDELLDEVTTALPVGQGFVPKDP